MHKQITDRTKIYLDEVELPKYWYNILADIDFELAPPLHPKTGKPLSPDDLEPLFPKSLIEQEMAQERFIDIPEEIQDVYMMWRPTPLMRAKRWEKYLQTTAKIYFKYEGISPVGSHKPNTAVPQAFFNKTEGVKRLTTETGAGQWGSALAFASSIYGLECTVYMVKISYQQKPYRKILMSSFGAEVIPSPSNRTEAGRTILKEKPDSYGSLGIAISEAIEDAVKNTDTKYSLGSVLNHVLLHQTIIGLETQKQFEYLGIEADILIGAVGGGSNFAGLTFPFIGEMLKNGSKKYKVIAVETDAVPSLTKGKYAYDYGDTVGLTPLIKMHTLGHEFLPPPIHAGGLRYHGMAPLVSALYEKGFIEAKAVSTPQSFEAAIEFMRCEGITPAPESAHAIKAVRDEALKAKLEGTSPVIVFNLSGHGHFDLEAYANHHEST